MPAMEEPAQAPRPAAKDSNAAPAMPAPAAPSMTSPTPIGRQSNHTPAPNLLDAAQVAIPQAPAIAGHRQRHHRHDSDRAGRAPVMTAPGKIGTVQVPPTEQLPDGIGGPVLRAAVMKGDAAAAYEIGLALRRGQGRAGESGRSREMV